MVSCEVHFFEEISLYLRIAFAPDFGGLRFAARRTPRLAPAAPICYG